jgi:translocation and assembly module TamA
LKIYSTIFLILVLVSVASGQERDYNINFFNNTDPKITTIEGRIDSIGFVQKVIMVQNHLFSSGYLLANVDALSYDTTYQATINVGKKYYWQSLGVNNIPEEMLSKAGYRKRDFEGRDFSVSAFSKLMNRLLQQSSKNGYPFAEFNLLDIEIRKGYVEGVLSYRPGPLIRFDSLTISPPNFINSRFLESYLNVKKGDLYNQEAIANISTRLNQLAYCNFNDSLALRYENNLCNISFELEPKKANRIDAIVGFFPNQNNTLRLTGFVNLHLENLFKSGKSLSLVWQQFQNASQKLQIDYRHPNFLRSTVGLEFDFDLLKQDSAFLNTDLNISGFFQSNRFEVAFQTNIKTSRTLSTPSDSLVIPEFVDFNLQQFGVNLSYNGVGNQINPIRGQKVFAEFIIGNKTIRKNTGVVAEVYDSLRLNSIQIKAMLGGELNQHISGPFTFHLNIQLATLYNNDVLFTNDLIRLGGVNSLRGFNDLELFVSSYGLARVEARLAFNQNSRLFAFYDQAVTMNSVSQFNDTPFGFGTGIFLHTAAGDLQLIYALGVSKEQSLSLTQSKIHIGYVARF